MVGEYWTHKLIRSSWLAVTGDSDIVDIRAIPRGAAVGYVAKYIGKSIPVELTAHAKYLDEAIIALKGRRMLIVSGEWYGKLSEDQEEERAAKHEWIKIDSLERIVHRANLGSIDDAKLLALLRIDPAPFSDRIEGSASG